MALVKSHSLSPSSPTREITLSLSPLQGFRVSTRKTTGPSAFDQTTQNLLKLGSLTMDKFAQDPSEGLDGFDISSIDLANPHAAGYYPGDNTAARHVGKEEEESDEIPVVSPTAAVKYLRDVAYKEFGTTINEPLKYEFLEDQGQSRKVCILTISRPNGLSRSYRTKAEFSRKSEAKIAAATSAIQLGAVHFIKHGEASKNLGKRGLVLAKLDAGTKKDEGNTKDPNKIVGIEGEGEGDAGNTDSAVDDIERCCLEWRAGSVVPRWIHIVDQKLANAHGCALKISLSTHIQRTYSVLVSVEYPKKSLAKAACARVALEQDVLHFIKHGDGLEHPVVIPFMGAEVLPPPPPPAVTTLQSFQAALPKPMPDHIGTKSNGEINAVAWLNNMIQFAKGSRMTSTFNWYTDTKLGLHGCLLRLTRPDAPSQSYFADAMFSKRADAKLAVCLLACSQGLGDYVRGVAAEIEARVSTDMKRRCTDQILPALGQALNKFKHGLRPDFSYECDLATFGCTLTIDLSSDSEGPLKRQWNVPLSYKSKADAKVAVLCAAADDGLIDFVKFLGKQPPTTEELGKQDEATIQGADTELEEGETMESEKKKKKKGKKQVVADGDAGDVEEGQDGGDLKMKGKRKDSGVPLFETKEEALARGRFDTITRGKKQQQRNLHGRGRGGGFGRPGSYGRFAPANARGGYPQFGFGPAGGRSFGASPGFSVPYPSYPVAPPPGVPPHFQHPHPYFFPSHGSGFPDGAFYPEYEHRDHSYLLADPGPAHERNMHGLGRTSVETAASFIHAPPPAQPPAGPAYHGYHDRGRGYDNARGHEYRPGPRVRPHFSSAVPPLGSVVPLNMPPQRPYGYPAAAVNSRPLPPPHASHTYRQTVAAEYSYETDVYAVRPTQGLSRAYEPGHFAPDYDRIPDRSVVVHESSRLPPSPSHVHTSAPLHRSGSAISLHHDLTTPHPPLHPSPSHSHSSHSRSSVAVVQLHPQPLHPRSYEPHADADYRAPTGLQHPHTAHDRPVDPVQGEGTHGHDSSRCLVQEEQLPSTELPARLPHAHVRPTNETHEKIEKTGEELDIVISRLEKVTDEKQTEQLLGSSNGRGGPSQLPSPISGRTSPSTGAKKSHSPNRRASTSDPGSTNVPSKRGRSSEWEEIELPSSKRARTRSRSNPLPSERGRSRDRQHGKSLPPEECEAGPEGTISPPIGRDGDGSETVKSSKRAREKSPATDKRKRSEQKDKSYIAALLEHCEKEDMPRPEFCHEEILSDKADKAFKVWIIMGKERLELPTSFPTPIAGQERVAKSVLGRLRVHTKKRKET